jgi:hypothetical protein
VPVGLHRIHNKQLPPSHSEYGARRSNRNDLPANTRYQNGRIEELARRPILTEYQRAVLAELKPLIKAMQFLRNTTLHGTVRSFGDDERIYFNLRSKNRSVNRTDLLSCGPVINYACHVTQAFRLSLGERGSREHTYALPDRPQIPEFLPPDCRALPPADKVAPLIRQKA